MTQVVINFIFSMKLIQLPSVTLIIVILIIFLTFLRFWMIQQAQINMFQFSLKTIQTLAIKSITQSQPTLQTIGQTSLCQEKFILTHICL